MSEKHLKNVNIPVIPLRIGIVYLLIASFLLTGVAFSKYVTSGEVPDSARVAGIGEIVITETGDIFSVSSAGETVNHTFIVAPGVNIKKDARLHFDGSEMACYIFLQVDPNVFATANHYDFANGKISWAVESSWNFLKEDGDKLVYYYIVPANGAIESKPILAGSEVVVSDTLTRTELDMLPSMLRISFRAFAVQYDGFGDFDNESEHALAAWNSVGTH